LREEFDRLTPENKQAGVKVQQILLKVAGKDLDAQVEQKAKDLIQKIHAASPETREKVFADLARGIPRIRQPQKVVAIFRGQSKGTRTRLTAFMIARLTCSRAMFRISRSGMRATGTFCSWRVSAEDL